ncbi:hypothetical protein Droror1_Dr00006535 [Drosera rotundifolia]
MKGVYKFQSLWKSLQPLTLPYRQLSQTRHRPFSTVHSSRLGRPKNPNCSSWGNSPPLDTHSVPMYESSSLSVQARYYHLYKFPQDSGLLSACNSCKQAPRSSYPMHLGIILPKYEK